ncbi:MAG TPA: ABC transporter permease [Thermoanaerobaculia bacterium]|nr:ABC transporter permease [Thermoanaerobaculia bacterium]
MHEQPRWRRYLRFWGPDVEADIEDELRFHLEMRERDFLAAGLPPDAAREEALARFGDPAKVARWLRDHDTRQLRRHRRIEIMSELLQDARYGLRRLRQGPGFTLATVVVLALGIGATTAIFSVIDASLLRPLPYPHPERLVSVTCSQEGVPTPVSFPEYLDWKRTSEVFSDVGGYFTTTVALTGQGEPEMLQAVRMSANLPEMLGVRPRLGRAFTPGEEARSAERVVMLSQGLWRRRFGGAPDILGRSVQLGEQPFTVIGIIPSGPRSIVPVSLAAAREADVWMPLRLDEEHAPRGVHFMEVAARLEPGLPLAQADERIATVASRLQEAEVTDHGIRLIPLELTVIGDARPLLVALAGAAAMVLLIACTNVANLLLARSAVRHREVAIRVALGAPRGRIVRQLLVESLLLSLLGGAAGVLVARAGVAGLRALGPASVPRLAEAAVDARMLGFALALSLLTGLLFGLLPALRASRTDLSEVMKVGAPGAMGVAGSRGGPARDRLRGSLIVAEVALSFALLIGAGLLIRSLDRLLAVDKGFDAERVVSAYLGLPDSRYPELHQQAAFYRELRERVAALPGVQAVAFVNDLLLQGGTNGGITIEGRTFPPESQPMAQKRIISPGYFDVLRTPVVAGRAFDDRDAEGATAVVVVNQAFVRRYFPGESPLGKRVDFGWNTTGMQQIVGVVGDVRETALHQPAEPMIYIPLAQRPEAWGFLVLRTSGDPMGVVPALRRTVAALDRNLPLSQVRTLEDVMVEGIAERRLAMSLFGAFSALSLLLAALGLYAVVSYTVVQRRREIGIRMALGARAKHVIGPVLSQGLSLIVAGAALGALASFWLGGFLSGLVFGIGTTDPATFAGVALLLMATALVASMVPALRAFQLHPASVLRSE